MLLMRQPSCKSLLLALVIILLTFYAFLHSLIHENLSEDYQEVSSFKSPNSESRNNVANTFFTSPITCKPGEEKRNFVYTKVHKTGSSTLTGIFYAFGYARNLSFIRAGKEISTILNSSDHVGSSTYQQSNRREHNIMCDHVVLNITKFKTFMPRDTVYIASIREPFARFVSAFHFFEVYHYTNLTNDDIPARTFMTNPDYYERLFQSECMRRPECYLLALRNGMSQMLGFRTGHPDSSVDWTYDQRQTDQWLQLLDKTLDLVLINEYLDESLVLLRRRMCWSTKDILYVSRNKIKKKYSANDIVFTKSTPESSSVAEKFYTWSTVDVKLYEHFSAKLWVQVAELEDVDTFWDEVARFKAILPQVSHLCAKSRNNSDVITLQAFDKKPFTLARSECFINFGEIFGKLKSSFMAL